MKKLPHTKTNTQKNPSQDKPNPSSTSATGDKLLGERWPKPCILIQVCICGCQVLKEKQWEAAEWMWLAAEKLPSPLMWLLAVLLDARSLLIYTTVVIQNPNEPQTSHYARLTLSAYRGSETEEKMSTTNANISVAKPQTLCCWSPGTVCCVL